MTSLRTAALVAACLVFPAVGCSTSRAMQRPERLTPEQAMAQAGTLSDALAGKKVTVELVSPRAHPLAVAPVVTGTMLAVDTQRFVLSEAPDRTYAIGMDVTRRLSATDRKKGGGEGMLVGAALGGAAGALVGFLSVRLGCDEDYDPPRCPSSAGTVVPLTTVGVLVGAGLGAGIGALIGHRLTFTF